MILTIPKMDIRYADKCAEVAVCYRAVHVFARGFNKR